MAVVPASSSGQTGGVAGATDEEAVEERQDRLSRPTAPANPFPGLVRRAYQNRLRWPLARFPAGVRGQAAMEQGRGSWAAGGRRR